MTLPSWLRHSGLSILARHFWLAWNWRNHAAMIFVVCSNWRVREIPNVNDSLSIGMEAWLLQFQASQKCLANILKPERCNQEGKITNFFISRNHGHYTETPPGYINSTNLPHLHFNLSPMAQVQPNKLSRLALLWCTLKFNTLFVIRILETHTSTWF